MVPGGQAEGLSGRGQLGVPDGRRQSRVLVAMETVTEGGLFQWRAHFLFGDLCLRQAAALVAEVGRAAATSCRDTRGSLMGLRGG